MPIPKVLPNKLPAHKSLPVPQGATPQTAPQSAMKGTADIWASVEKFFGIGQRKGKASQKAPSLTENMNDPCYH